MSRPTYETAADLNNEQRVAAILKSKGFTAVKLPVQYRLDWAIIDDETGKISSFGEVKSRTVAMDKYPDAMVSLSKVIKANDISACTNLPCYLIVLYRDALARVDFASEFQVRPGGRSDRNDPQDRDVCAYYPITSFTIVERF
jgi:hypothetical protein